ncbi:hypothetical protein BKA70DRAFT_1265639 [Coprinopsis sp. MPI-PUGE-AT-0042]|nr:hypothetical protein BKA70DRAFT_1265639 [Coprinopsis sp. MPI-PUGE-AT-0042]
MQLVSLLVSCLALANLGLGVNAQPVNETESVDALAFEYHKNEVSVPYTAGNGITADAAGFTVEEFSITDGQDPDGRNRAGDTRFISPDGFGIYFHSGRKGSTQVRDWFVSRVSSGQTTFNHDPDLLNFAFLGKMWFVFSGNGLVKERFDMDKTMLAQGRSFTSNNWWFGGRNCNHIGNDEVRCRLTRVSRPDQGGWEMVFKRGGNDVSTVEAKNLSGPF